jgi:dephospho-CoA kinase
MQNVFVMIIAITGNLGCGKSTVLKAFAKLGFKTMDCDKVVKRLYLKPEVRKKLRDMFGTTSKKKIGTMVFDEPKKRRKLEALLHPLVAQEVRDFIKRANNTSTDAAIEIPLLFEAQGMPKFDFTVLVYCDREKVKKRLRKKGLSGKYVEKVWAAQMPYDEKLRHADVLIDNNGTKKETFLQVKAFLEIIGEDDGKDS